MKRILLYLLFLLGFTSCDDFLEVAPNTSELYTELVFENDNTAIAALEGIYHELQFSGFSSGDFRSLSFLGNTLADDGIEYNVDQDRSDFYTNTIRADNSTNYSIWSSAYKQLYSIHPTNRILSRCKSL